MLEDAAQPKKKKVKVEKPVEASNKPGRKAALWAAQEITQGIAGEAAGPQADWVWARYQQDTGASSLERDGLTRECFASVPRAGRLEDSLAALPDQGCLNRAGSAGAPAALIVTSSAIRAVELIRQCPSYHQVVGVHGPPCSVGAIVSVGRKPLRPSIISSGCPCSHPPDPFPSQACKIMKLFAKHLKVEEQETMLSSTKAAIAVGTPNRLLKLAERGSLKLGRLRYIILDVQLDSKKRWERVLL